MNQFNFIFFKKNIGTQKNLRVPYSFSPAVKNNCKKKKLLYEK